MIVSDGLMALFERASLHRDDPEGVFPALGQ
jgi:hypothetical protein